jgi:hypothetical protein
MTEEIELTERQNEILGCVRNNPNSCIKQRIVDSLTADGKGSRKTILKDIEKLVEYGILYIDKKKPNSQVHYVRENNDSILLPVIEHIRNLKDTFSLLIDETKKTFDEMYETIESYDMNIMDDVDKFTNDRATIAHAQLSLQRLFQHSIGIYILYSLFVWPQEVTDKKTLDKLYTVVFEGLKEIQIKLSEVFMEKSSSELMISDIIDDLFTLKPEVLYSTIINLEYAGLGRYGEAVLDPLWKFGFRFVPDALLHVHHYMEEHKRRRLNMTDKLKDWRIIVKEHVNNLPPDQKKWSRAVSDKY